MTTEQSERYPRYVMLCLLLLHGFTLGWSATWQSPTLNEPGHLASGIAVWDLGRFDPYRVNPPLVRMVAAIPVILNGSERDWSSLSEGPGVRSEFTLGRDFVAANGPNSIWLFNIARWACIPFSLLGGWCCFLWGRALWNGMAGIFAGILWCVSPNILAHGQLITPDVAASSLGLASAYCVWNWLSKRTWNWAFVAGLFLGLSQLAKSTWLILYVIWPAIWILWKYLSRNLQYERSPKTSVEFAQLITILCVALYVVNLVYAFDGSFTRLGEFEFVSQALASPDAGQVSGNIFKDSRLADVPVPFPKQYILGIDHQKKDFEKFPFRSYLRGEWKQGGWWYYYLYGFLVKVPLGTLGLMIVSLVTIVIPITSQDDQQKQMKLIGAMLLLIPAVAIVVIASSQTSFNHHFRYVLPAFGPLYILASRPIVIAFQKSWRSRFLLVVQIVLLSITLCTSVKIAPRFISYFNWAAGGSRNGHLHMIHSNLDWGQDLYHLQNWITDHPQKKPIILAYYGFYDPADLGIDYSPAPYGPSSSDHPKVPVGAPGYYAISVNYLIGSTWNLQGGDYGEFRDMVPVAKAGDSIWIFHVE